MTNCIFCKIVAGEIPCTKIYEDDKVLTFLDINPANKGHSITITKNHVEDIFEADADQTSHLMEATKKVGDATKKGLDAAWIQIVLMGEQIRHVHVHAIPRFEGDGLPISKWAPKKYDEGEANQVAWKIRENL